MVIKRIRAPLFALAALVLSAALVMPVAAAAASPPAGFAGNEIASVDLEVDSGYAWHTMTNAEAAAYSLDANGGTVYVAGNSGKPESGGLEKAVSNLAVTVTEPGALTFEYAVDAYWNSDYPGFANNSYLGYSIGTPITTADGHTVVEDGSCCIAHGPNQPGVGNWASYTINVDSSSFASTDTVTVYIAYQHIKYYGGATETDLNYAAIRNVTYSTGSFSVLGDYNSEMGSVTAEAVRTYINDAGHNVTEYTPTALEELAIGSTYRLTAKAASGHQFYGWFRTYVYEGKEYTAYEPSENGGIQITVSETTWYTPIFASSGSYVARNGTAFYTEAEGGVEQALSEAKLYDTVVVMDDYCLDGDVTVPAGVTLYVPFRDSWGTAESSGKYFYSTKDTDICGTAIAGKDKTYVTLTVAEGTTLTVNGTLAVGSVNGYPSQRYQGHVSGAHGRITNNGTIEVNDGAKLHAIGIVDGNGLVYVNDGGTLRESMIICDFAGGSNSADLYYDNQMPFKRFAMQNVQCDLKMEARSTLMALGNIYALSSFVDVDVELFGDSTMAAFRPNTVTADTIALTRTYDGSMSLTDGAGLLDVTGIGRTNWTFSGGMTFQPFTIDAGIQLSTINADLPIPYNFKITLTNGTYNISSGLRLMPGAEVTVESSAIVKLGGRLLIMDGLVQTDMSTDRYPNKDELTAKGYKPYGVATLNGKLIMETGSTLGGVINSAGGGTLVLQEGVYLINGSENLLDLDPTIEDLKDQPQLANDTYASIRKDGYYTGINNWVQQDGAQGTYDENTVWFNLPAKLYNGAELFAPEAGKTYVSTGVTAATVSDKYQGLYVPNGEYTSSGYTSQGTAGVRDMNDGSYPFTRTVNATWSDGTASIPVTVAETVPGFDNENSPAYGAKILVDSLGQADGTAKVTVTTDSTTTSAVFVHLVKCQYADGTEEIIANADGKYRDGEFTIPATAVSATVESGIVGDLDGSGTINARDVSNARKYVLKTTSISDLAVLASDIDNNGSVNGRDVGNLRKTVLKTYTIGE